MLAAKHVATVGELASLSEQDLRALTWLGDPVGTVRRLLHEYQTRAKKPGRDVTSSPMKPLETVRGNDSDVVGGSQELLATPPVAAAAPPVPSLQESATISPVAAVPPLNTASPSTATPQTAEETSRKRPAVDNDDNEEIQPVAKVLRSLLDERSLDGLSVDDLLDVQNTVATLTSTIANQLRSRMKK